MKLHHPTVSLNFDMLGSEYGGWPVIRSSISSSSVIYSFGVGNDITFDNEVIERFGCRVFAFDPTPRSIRWISAQTLSPLLRFYPLGLGRHDGTMMFFAPADDTHFSYSAKSGGPGATAANGIPGDICTLRTIMERLGHDRVDLVKMDIEGSEYEALESMIASHLLPRQLLVEFHHGLYDIDQSNTVEAVERLLALDYTIFYVSERGREYGLVRTV